MRRVPFLQNQRRNVYRRPILGQRVKGSQITGVRSNTAPKVSKNTPIQVEKYIKDITLFSNTLKDINTSAQKIMNIDFGRRKDVSANTHAITGDAKDDAKEACYDVTVSQLAAVQQNDGASVKGNAFGCLAAGSYTFGISTGEGAEKKISIDIVSSDTNQEILNKIASAINSSDAGVNAGLKMRGSLPYLRLESKTTGEGNSFSIRDITGSCVSVLRLTNITQRATDAKYTIDGQKQQSADNKVSLDKGNVILSLKDTTSGMTKVNVGDSRAKMVESVRDLVNQYNQLNAKISASNNITLRGKNLLSGVQTLIGKLQVKDFNDIGISINRMTGNIILDEKKLVNSNQDKLKMLLTGNNGFASNLANTSKSAMTVPVSYYISNSNPLLDYGDYASYGSPYNNPQPRMGHGLFLNYRG